MGYYTDFKLTSDIDHNDVMVVEIYDRLSVISGYSAMSPGESHNRKWYKHDDDMLVLSTEYPDVLFMLEGVGEEIDYDNPDVWKTYYRNGKFQDCKMTMTFESFDESKMK